VVPVLGILICGYMMYGLPRDTWLRLLIWMALGLAIYFLYGARHSALLKRPGA
jgi:APA family basic amino acid/polyamine antiporter